MAVRARRRAPTLAIAATLVLSLGIGANAALFTLVRAVLLRPMPQISTPATLVNVHGTDAAGELFGGFSHPDFLDYRERGAAETELAAFTDRGMTGLRLALLGSVGGLAMAWGAGRALAAFLTGVSPADPHALLGASSIVGLVALAASWVPARRAAQVDPVVALRAE